MGLWSFDTCFFIECHGFRYILKTDVKNFYTSIYTHSISWAIHTKVKARKERNNFGLLGNKLDKLFQNANDGCTNGIPIGPVVSDIIAEVIASAVDLLLSNEVKRQNIDCCIVRFKDDYKVLTHSEEGAKKIIKILQSSLKEYNLELNEAKTSIQSLPNGLFREWVSEYYKSYPQKIKKFKWRQFRELYLAVLTIDDRYPGTGVIDRFLSDIIDKEGQLKVSYRKSDIQKIMSMLLLIGRRRIKAFPKVIAIIESVLLSKKGSSEKEKIAEYLEDYLYNLSKDEFRNKYLITWVGYFLVSNKLLTNKPSSFSLTDPITCSIINNRGKLFKKYPEYKLFTDCVTTASKITMLEHLDVFNPPKPN